MVDQSTEYRQILETLRGVDFLSSLKVEEMDKLIGCLKKMSCTQNYVVIREGDKGDTFYMIFKGKVSIWATNKTGKKVYINTMTEGNFFGEIALLEEIPRTATVVAEEPCDFYILYRDDFNSIVRHNNRLYQMVEKVIRERLDDTKHKINEKHPG